MQDKIRELYEKPVTKIFIAIVLASIPSAFLFIESKMGGIVSAINLASLFFIIEYLFDIKKSIIVPPFKVYENQTEANRDLIDFINSKRPKEVYMVEYSSKTVDEILRTLVSADWKPKIYLLLQHPKEVEKIVGQKKRIWEQITTTIYHEEKLRDCPYLKILCYTQRTSFRGRKFDDELINIGWYTYERDTIGEEHIHGGDRPVINFKRGEKGFDEIEKMFNGVFKNLWENSVRLNEVCEEYEDEFDLHSDSGFIEWCKNVSPTKGEREIETKR
ncbi:MAG: hypothetical protein SVY15_08790 [Halobacteriota archaeon]|nr:hypothetical protein [Halobacteriota archaeon]